MSPDLAFSVPSANPIVFDSDSASLYFCRASEILPSISKNSPRLCVAVAHPISHSSFLSGGFMMAANASALLAHCRALSTSTSREGGGPFEIIDTDGGGGVCWARHEEILFTDKGVSRADL